MRLDACTVLSWFLQSESDFNQRFGVISLNVLSVYYTSIQQVMCSGRVQTSLSPIPVLSWTQLASVLGWPSVNAKSCAQPTLSIEIVFTSVNGLCLVLIVIDLVTFLFQCRFLLYYLYVQCGTVCQKYHYNKWIMMKFNVIELFMKLRSWCF